MLWFLSCKIKWTQHKWKHEAGIPYLAERSATLTVMPWSQCDTSIFHSPPGNRRLGATPGLLTGSCDLFLTLFSTTAASGAYWVPGEAGVWTCLGWMCSCIHNGHRSVQVATVRGSKGRQGKLLRLKTTQASENVPEGGRGCCCIF